MSKEQEYECKPPTEDFYCEWNREQNISKCQKCPWNLWQPKKPAACPNCNGTGILAYCDLCSGTGEKPPTREDFKYMEGFGEQPKVEGFVENLDLQPKVGFKLDELQRGMKAAMNPKHEPEMPRVENLISYPPDIAEALEAGKIRQRRADMAWHNEKVQQVRREFAERVCKMLPAQNGCGQWESCQKRIRAMAEGKE